MERRNGCENIGITSIDTFENGNTQKFVKSAKASYIAWRGKYWFKTIVHGIPGRSSRVNIVSDKTYQIDQQENHRETQVHAALPLEIEPQAESNGNRHPTEIENAGHKIGHTTMVLSKELTRNQRLSAHCNAKQAFLSLIKSLHIDGVYFVIGPYSHPIIRYSENNKRKQSYRKLSGIAS